VGERTSRSGKLRPATNIGAAKISSNVTGRETGEGQIFYNYPVKGIASHGSSIEYGFRAVSYKHPRATIAAYCGRFEAKRGVIAYDDGSRAAATIVLNRRGRRKDISLIGRDAGSGVALEYVIVAIGGRVQVGGQASTVVLD